MSAEQSPAIPEPSEEEVAPVVAVSRTLAGVVLVIIGVVSVIAGAFWYWVVPWFGWAMEGFWYEMSEWADLGGMAMLIIGFLILIVGGALIQRARKRNLEIFMDRSAFAKPAEEPRSTTPPPIV